MIEKAAIFIISSKEAAERKGADVKNRDESIVGTLLTRRDFGQMPFVAGRLPDEIMKIAEKAHLFWNKRERILLPSDNNDILEQELDTNIKKFLFREFLDDSFASTPLSLTDQTMEVETFKGMFTDTVIKKLRDSIERRKPMIRKWANDRDDLLIRILDQKKAETHKYILEGIQAIHKKQQEVIEVTNRIEKTSYAIEEIRKEEGYLVEWTVKESRFIWNNVFFRFNVLPEVPMSLNEKKEL